MSLLHLIAAVSPPAGGAPVVQIVIASAFGLVMTVALLWLVHAHRSGRTAVLRRASDLSARVAGVPGWAALPAGVALAGGASALFGVYWDISLHIDNGRDEGPLANPSHYFILLGLYAMLAGAVLSLALAEGQDVGRSALRLRAGWDVPVGGALLLGCASFALLGFPLDDVWHRLFGQDVTLWGPTHVMMIGGAAAAVIVAFSVLWVEGTRAGGRDPRRPSPGAIARGARAALPIGILLVVGLFAGEFDWGVPQFRQVWHPLLLALASGLALTLARIWVGPGGALAAAAGYVAIRLGLSLIVGGALGQSTPAMPIFAVEALGVEAAALALSPRRSPLAFGAAAGLLCGTAGFAFEYGWSQLVMPLPWTPALLPEAVPTAVVAGVAGGLLGALFALALRGELPRPAVARAFALASSGALVALGANALVYRVPDDVHVAVMLQETRSGAAREAYATVRFDRPSVTRDAEWVSVLAWQGDRRRVLDRLRPVGDGAWRTTRAVPLHGAWKTLVRVHSGRVMLAAPLYLPRDGAIPSPGLTLPARSTQRMVHDQRVLQIERKPDVPAWLWTTAVTAVLAMCGLLLFLIALGTGRVARAHAPLPSRAATRGLIDPGSPLPAA
jgi:hypothetical protein